MQYVRVCASCVLEVVGSDRSYFRHCCCHFDSGGCCLCDMTNTRFVIKGFVVGVDANRGLESGP